jgi:hypothetical protein
MMTSHNTLNHHLNFFHKFDHILILFNQNLDCEPYVSKSAPADPGWFVSDVMEPNSVEGLEPDRENNFRSNVFQRRERNFVIRSNSIFKSPMLKVCSSILLSRRNFSRA